MITMHQVEELARKACNIDKVVQSLHAPADMFPPSIYYKFLYLLAFHMKPTCSVELGVCSGGGSYHLALGHAAGDVIGIDVANDYPSHINFIKSKCPNFTFMQEDSIKAAASHDHFQVDILFIDTIHTYQRAVDEFLAWEPIMKPHGVVLLDDMRIEGMERAWDYISAKHTNARRFDELHISGSPTDGGFGVVLL